MFRPHIVNYVEDIVTRKRTVVEPQPLRTLDVKPEHLAVVKNAMVGVNKEGTGARAFAGAPYVSAGKTGTAQVVAIKQGEKYVESRVQERHRDHALFIAYAPADDPKIALAVLVENAGFGARAAAPIARQVFDYYLLGKQPTPLKPGEGDADDPAIRRFTRLLTAHIDGPLLMVLLLLMGDRPRRASSAAPTRAARASRARCSTCWSPSASCIYSRTFRRIS